MSTNSEVHAKFLTAIQKKQNAAKKVKDLWLALNDGKPHGIKSVANQLGYTNVQSQGFKDAKNQLIRLGLTIEEKSSKTLQLCSFLFPFTTDDNDVIHRTEHPISFDEGNVVSI